MIALSITADDSISPDLRRLLRTLDPAGPVGKILGRAAANELRRHFRALNGKRANRLGGPRSNFYSRVAETVNAPRVVPGAVVVQISHPHIAQRLFGGTLRPRKAKALAVPVDATAYGVYPRIYPGTLAFIPARGKGETKGYLVDGEMRTVTRGENEGTERAAPKPGGRLLYVLRGSIVQRADPSILPDQAVMHAALDRATRLIR